jgi:hypothetical protein
MSSTANKRIVSACRFLVTAVCLGFVYYAVVPERNYFYRSTFDKPSNTYRQENYIKLQGRAKFWFNGPPDFLIQGRTVFLLTRQTSIFPFFMAVSKRDKTWTVGQVRALSSTHSEIKEMWPDPAASNLGIDWIEVSPAVN